MGAGGCQRCRAPRGRCDRELIRARPGRRVARVQAANREPLQRGSLGFRHRDHGPRHRPHCQRTVDQQQRIDGAIHLLPPGLVLTPVCRVAGTRRIPLHARGHRRRYLQPPVFPDHHRGIIHIRRRTQQRDLVGGQSDFAANQVVIGLLPHALDQVVALHVVCCFAALVIDQVA